MNIELSPSQERRLHLILDKGLISLNDSAQESCQVAKEDLDLTFSSSASKTSNFSKVSKDSHSFGKLLDLQDSQTSKLLKKDELSELRILKEKLADLESKIQKKPGKNLFKPKELPSHKAGPSKNSAKSHSGRPSSASKARVSIKSRENHNNRASSRIHSMRKIETSEKMIQKLERSITASPDLKLSQKSVRGIENISLLSENELKKSEKLRKENEKLRKELASQAELSEKLVKLQEDYKTLAASFEKSEEIRKKQKLLIEQLKSEIRSSETLAKPPQKKKSRLN